MYNKINFLFCRPLIVLTIICSICLSTVGAEDLSELMGQKGQAEAMINEYQGRLEWANQTHNQYVNDLAHLDNEIYHSKSKLNQLQVSLSVLDSEIATLQERINETENRRQGVDELAKDRLRNLYKNSTVSYLEVLFEATSYSDFIQRFDLIRTLLESDLELLEQIQTIRITQDNDKRKLEDELSEQKRLEEEEEYYKYNLENQQDEKIYLIDDILSQREAFYAALEEWEAAAESFGEQIRKLQEANRNTSLGSGSYAWPLSWEYTYITSEFGTRDDPFGGSTTNNHGGMDIAADTGADILAADSGIVIDASYGYNGGYGNMVLIDHGLGLATLYGHCSAIYVSVGQSVAKGEVIAAVGSTGWSTGPHLHIEFRQDGVRQEPRDYLFN